MAKLCKCGCERPVFSHSYSKHCQYLRTDEKWLKQCTAQGNTFYSNHVANKKPSIGVMDSITNKKGWLKEQEDKLKSEIGYTLGETVIRGARFYGKDGVLIASVQTPTIDNDTEEDELPNQMDVDLKDFSARLFKAKPLSGKQKDLVSSFAKQSDKANQDRSMIYPNDIDGSIKAFDQASKSLEGKHKTVKWGNDTKKKRTSTPSLVAKPKSDYKKIYTTFFEIGEDDSPICENNLCNNLLTDVHHIDNKGMGGSGNKDYIENLMGLCRSCHTQAHNHKTFNERLRVVHLSKVLVKLKSNIHGSKY